MHEVTRVSLPCADPALDEMQIELLYLAAGIDCSVRADTEKYLFRPVSGAWLSVQVAATLVHMLKCPQAKH